MCWMCGASSAGESAYSSYRYKGDIHTYEARPSSQMVGMTGDFKKDVILQGSKWDNTNLTYSMWNNVFELYKDPTLRELGKLFGGWDAKGKVAFQKAIATFETFTNLKFTFVETGGKPSLTTDIEAMPTGFIQQVTLGSVGLGVFPNKAFGDQWLQLMNLTRNEFPNVEGSIYFDNFHEVFKYSHEGGKGYWVMLHEIGHTLGMKHTHDDGGNKRPSLKSLGLEQYDNTMYTMMSYKAPPGGTLDKGNVATPMVWDMLALQDIYGTNWAYHSGNDVYKMADNGIVKTIWDGGGKDLIDASEMTAAVNIDLRAGQYSKYGNTIGAVAYKVTLEDASAGSGNDTVVGNEVSNVLAGGGGNDSIRAGASDDTIYGGRGLGDPNDGSDVIYGDKGSDVIYGNSGNDTIYGGTGGFDPLDNSDSISGGLGDDVIYGNASNDTINGGGGNDTIHGGVGDDVYQFDSGSGVDTILHFTGAGASGGDVLAVFDHLNGSDIVTASDVLEHATRQGSDLVIDFGSGNVLTIIGAASLGAGDIIIL